MSSGNGSCLDGDSKTSLFSAEILSFSMGSPIGPERVTCREDLLASSSNSCDDRISGVRGGKGLLKNLTGRLFRRCLSSSKGLFINFSTLLSPGVRKEE